MTEPMSGESSVDPSRDLLRSVLEDIPDAVAISDTEANFTVYNRAAEKLLNIGSLTIRLRTAPLAAVCSCPMESPHTRNMNCRFFARYAEKASREVCSPSETISIPRAFR